MNNIFPPLKNAEASVTAEDQASFPACQTAEAWREAKELAAAMLREHTASLRLLSAQMRRFNHQTPVEVVEAAQGRCEALRWLTQVIEEEVQILDKAYREAGQREQFLREQAMLTAV